MGREAEAIAALKAGLPLAPNDHHMHELLGRYCLTLGAFDIGWREYNTLGAPAEPATGYQALGGRGTGRKAIDRHLRARIGRHAAVPSLRAAAARARRRGDRGHPAVADRAGAIGRPRDRLDRRPPRRRHVRPAHRPVEPAIHVRHAPGDHPATHSLCRRRHGKSRRLGGNLLGSEGFRIGVAWQGSMGPMRDDARSIPPALFKLTRRSPACGSSAFRPTTASNRLPICRKASSSSGSAENRIERGRHRGNRRRHGKPRSHHHIRHNDRASRPRARPARLVVQADADWRWLRNRTDTSWYPTMRLFRQQRAGDWPAVVAAMAARLEEETSTKLSKDKQKSPRRKPGLPTREQILAFIAEHPGEAGKRDIARAFGVTGAARIPLKAMLKELADEGLVERRSKRLKRPDDLPSVTVLEVTGRDRDGEFLARPAEWSDAEGGPPPPIIVAPARDRRGPAPGIGDRVLARLSPAGERRRRLRGARHQASRKEAGDRARRRPRPPRRQTHRAGRPQAARADPRRRSDRQGEGRRPRLGDAGRLGPLRPEPRPHRRGHRLDEEREGGLDDRHPRPRHPPRVPADVLAEAEAAEAGDAGAPRGLARAAAGHHRPARRQGPRRRRPRRARRRPEEPRRLHRHRRHRRCRLVCAPGQRPRPRGARRAATRSISPTASCRCCPSASPTTCARCARARTGPALAVRMVFAADGRKRSPPLPSRDDALGRQALLQPGAGRHRRRARRHAGAAASPRCSLAVGRLSAPQARARRARAAGPRPARAQGAARAPTARSTASSCPSGWRPTG